MAETGDRNDPFVAFRFEVRIDGLAAGGFSECGGLQIETEVEEYAEGGLNTHTHKFPGRSKQTNLTLKQGVVGRVMYDWYLDLVNGNVRRKSGSVLVRDPGAGQVLAEWQFDDAFPSKWTGPELNATQSNVAVETFELCHRGLRRRT